jgi:hypothetical protein
MILLHRSFPKKPALLTHAKLVNNYNLSRQKSEVFPSAKRNKIEAKARIRDSVNISYGTAANWRCVIYGYPIIRNCKRYYRLPASRRIIRLHDTFTYHEHVFKIHCRRRSHRPSIYECHHRAGLLQAGRQSAIVNLTGARIIVIENPSVI